MKKLAKQLSALACVIVTSTALTSVTANAKTEYHVYIKDGSCKIDMRTPDAWKKAHGSDWQYVGKDSTRSGAKKKAKKIGC